MYGSTETSTSFVANYAQLQTNICALGKPLKTVKYKLQVISGDRNELLIKSGLTNIKSDSIIQEVFLIFPVINGKNTIIVSASPFFGT